jgi:hypothetical protein
MASQHWTDKYAPIIVVVGLIILGAIMYKQYKATEAFVSGKKK